MNHPQTCGSRTQPLSVRFWGLGPEGARERRKLAEGERSRGRGGRRAWRPRGPGSVTGVRAPAPSRTSRPHTHRHWSGEWVPATHHPELRPEGQPGAGTPHSPPAPGAPSSEASSPAELGCARRAGWGSRGRPRPRTKGPHLLPSSAPRCRLKAAPAAGAPAFESPSCASRSTRGLFRGEGSPGAVLSFFSSSFFFFGLCFSKN